MSAIIDGLKTAKEYIRMSWRALWGEFGFYPDD